jgi:hypothetical protein
MIISEKDCRLEAGLQQRISVRLARDVRELLPFIRDTWELLERTYNSGGRVLVEGTQGQVEISAAFTLLWVEQMTTDPTRFIRQHN